MRDEVAVVGAGTAGLLAAKRLAELGIETQVYDQKERPGIPVRASGILSISGLETLGIDYRKVVTNTLCGAKLHMGSEVLNVRAPRPIAKVLDRFELNELCYADAQKLGARMITKSKVDGKLLESLNADKFIVGADGAVSVVARHFGFPEIPRHVLTYRAEYDYRLVESDMVELFFDNKMIPGFFGWISPNSKDVAEIGIGIDSASGNSRAAFERFKKVSEIAQIVAGGKIIGEGASIIPIGIRKHFVDDKRGVLLVGDAAGQVKPTTGGGIIFGGNGARYAAQAISACISKGASLEYYERSWRKEFQKEMVLHSFFYNMYASMNSGQLAWMAKVLKFMGFEKFLAQYGDMDRPSLMIKRFLLRGLAK
ncbi:MAG: NAD(P)/FAD-dependent oxidoreductase [Candidatus Micrarchaeota archaeon]|nr:NAD(P)/FAD-dependent oxidoreductase [Candidatus Micrarchaeota archaeon]